MSCRKKVLALLLVGAMLAAAPVVQAAEESDYPERNINVIIPYSAGGPTDMSVRAILDASSPYLPDGVSFMPENRTGAGGLVGMTATAHAAPDGYTLGSCAVDLLMMHYEGNTELSMDFYTPLVACVADPYGVVIKKDNGKFTNLDELVAYAKEHPGELTVGNSGVGTATHLSALALEDKLGIEFTHVPYDGSADVVAALAGGHIDVAMCQMMPAKAQVDAGELEMIGIMADERMESWPDIPTVSETLGVDFTVRGWNVLCAPAGLKEDQLAYLQDIFGKAIKEEGFKEAIRNIGMEPVELIGEDLTNMLAEDDAFYKELCAKVDLKS